MVGIHAVRHHAVTDEVVTVVVAVASGTPYIEVVVMVEGEVVAVVIEAVGIVDAVSVDCCGY